MQIKMGKAVMTDHSVILMAGNVKKKIHLYYEIATLRSQ
jgi:hypothetical protein